MFGQFQGRGLDDFSVAVMGFGVWGSGVELRDAAGLSAADFESCFMAQVV